MYSMANRTSSGNLLCHLANLCGFVLPHPDLPTEKLLLILPKPRNRLDPSHGEQKGFFITKPRFEKNEWASQPVLFFHSAVHVEAS